MQLSILNYGSGIDVQIPKQANKEDNELLAYAGKIVEARAMGKGALLVSEVMHTDLPNLNWRRYMKKGMAESAQTFYAPIFTPFLMHHDSAGTTKILPVGSTVYAKFYGKATETPVGTASGYIKVATFIPDNSMVEEQRAIDAIQARQIMGLSIGSRVTEENYICSICKKSLYSDDCDHYPGRLYNKERCFVDIYSPLFREYSSVNSPADITAIVRRMDVMDSEGNTGLDDAPLIDQVTASWNVSLYECITPVYALGGISEQPHDTDESGGTETMPETKDTNYGILQSVLESCNTTIKIQNEALLTMSNLLKDHMKYAETICATAETIQPTVESISVTAPENPDTTADETTTATQPVSDATGTETPGSTTDTDDTADETEPDKEGDDEKKKDTAPETQPVVDAAPETADNTGTGLTTDNEPENGTDARKDYRFLIKEKRKSKQSRPVPLKVKKIR